MVAPVLTPSARLRQLRVDLRQALKSQDAATLQRLSLKVIHRQGASALEILLQTMADESQQRFWLAALQPSAAPVLPPPSSGLVDPQTEQLQALIPMEHLPVDQPGELEEVSPVVPILERVENTESVEADPLLEAIEPLTEIESELPTPVAAEIESIGLEEVLKTADEPLDQRDEQIKELSTQPRRPLVQPAPLERSRLHQRLKGWLPHWEAHSQRAA